MNAWRRRPGEQLEVDSVASRASQAGRGFPARKDRRQGQGVIPAKEDPMNSGINLPGGCGTSTRLDRPVAVATMILALVLIGSCLDQERGPTAAADRDASASLLLSTGSPLEDASLQPDAHSIPDCPQVAWPWVVSVGVTPIYQFPGGGQPPLLQPPRELLGIREQFCLYHHGGEVHTVAVTGTISIVTDSGQPMVIALDDTIPWGSGGSGNWVETVVHEHRFGPINGVTYDVTLTQDGELHRDVLRSFRDPFDLGSPVPVDPDPAVPIQN